jgi:N-acetylneuraminate synthase
MAGTILVNDMLEELRPAPKDAVFPYRNSEVIGRRLIQTKEQGDYLRFTDLE